MTSSGAPEAGLGLTRGRTHLAIRSVRSISTLVAAILAVAIAFAAYTAQSSQAHHEPANKVAVAGSTVEVIGKDEPPVSIMQETMRVASPTDLGILVQLECSLVTNVKTVGDDDQTAMAQFDVWVTLDGEEVPVAATVPQGAGADDGHVTFSNREYRRKVSGLANNPNTDLSDDDLTIETFLSTKSTHGFNWIALDSGGEYYDKNNDNILDIQVWADYTETESDAAKVDAEAIIGKRTLIVQPDNYSVHEAVLERPGTGN